MPGDEGGLGCDIRGNMRALFGIASEGTPQETSFVEGLS